jgi:hypothetical protein
MVMSPTRSNIGATRSATADPAPDWNTPSPDWLHRIVVPAGVTPVTATRASVW